MKISTERLLEKYRWLDAQNFYYEIGSPSVLTDECVNTFIRIGDVDIYQYICWIIALQLTSEQNMQWAEYVMWVYLDAINASSIAKDYYKERITKYNNRIASYPASCARASNENNVVDVLAAAYNVFIRHGYHMIEKIVYFGIEMARENDAKSN